MPKKSVQFNLFGEPDEEPKRKRPSTLVVPFDFESVVIRVVIIRGVPWWVLTDVARVLGYGSAKDAGRTLRDNHKGRHLVPTPGGPQEMLVINEPGLYRLMMRSDRSEAERFQDWITDVVLPTLRRTGTYSLPSRDDRIAKVAKRLKVDRATAKIRVDQYAINRNSNLRLASEGRRRHQFPGWYNAGYRGQFGKDARGLRNDLGLKSCRQSPLDHMEALPLALNGHAKELTEHKIQAMGGDIPSAEQDRILEQTTRNLREADFGHLKPWGDHEYGIVDDPHRGKIIGVVKRQLPCS